MLVLFSPGKLLGRLVSIPFTLPLGTWHQRGRGQGVIDVPHLTLQPRGELVAGRLLLGWVTCRRPRVPSVPHIYFVGEVAEDVVNLIVEQSGNLRLFRFREVRLDLLQVGRGGLVPPPLILFGQDGVDLPDLGPDGLVFRFFGTMPVAAVAPDPDDV